MGTYKKYAKLRDEGGLTDYQVSKDTGIAPSSLSDWKKGRYNFKLDKLMILAKYFDKDIEYFIK